MNHNESPKLFTENQLKCRRVKLFVNDNNQSNEIENN